MTTSVKPSKPLVLKPSSLREANTSRANQLLILPPSITPSLGRLYEFSQPSEKISPSRNLLPSNLPFSKWLPFWHFVNRESTGRVKSVHTFASLWDGQREFADFMERESWVYALKAGKLGFTELECAYDAYRGLYGGENARVHVFSMGDREAKELLSYIRFGIEHLPAEWGIRLMVEAPGGATVNQLRIRMGVDDIRTITSYPSKQHTSIDLSCIHAHLDELARMPWPSDTWDAVSSTIAPGGTCHIVTRGLRNYAAELWEQCQQDDPPLFPFFVDYTARPGRDDAWREREARGRTPFGLAHYAPRSPEEALSGEGLALVYPMVSRERHFVRLPCAWKDYELRVAAVDLGGTDPQALVGAGLYRGHVYEHYERWWPGGSGMTIDDAVNAVWQMHKEAPLKALLIDPPLKSIVDYFISMGLPAMARPANKWAGIEDMAMMLGSGTLLHGVDCKQSWREYQSYSARPATDPNSKERYQTGTPVDHHGDVLDCIRYIVDWVITNRVIYYSGPRRQVKVTVPVLPRIRSN